MLTESVESGGSSSVRPGFLLVTKRQFAEAFENLNCSREPCYSRRRMAEPRRPGPWLDPLLAGQKRLTIRHAGRASPASCAACLLVVASGATGAAGR